jgi:hypothetical protein
MAAACMFPLLVALDTESSRLCCTMMLKVIDVLLKPTVAMIIVDVHMLPKY